jgi:oligoribonuclease
MKLLWLDMEMSGLDPEKCRILEVAALVTDRNFNILGTYEAVVHQPPEVLSAMDEWCQQQHGSSGLTKAVASGKAEALVESELLAFTNSHFEASERPILSGNSIGQDRKFIDRYWPSFSSRLHYRMLDVTSWKILFNGLWSIAIEKKGGHRALDDIQESIKELKHYVSFVNPSPKGPGIR